MATWLYIGAKNEWVNMDQVTNIKRSPSGGLEVWVGGKPYGIPVNDADKVERYVQAHSVDNAQP